jgi:hypothetical protein
VVDWQKISVACLKSLVCQGPERENWTKIHYNNCEEERFTTGFLSCKIAIVKKDEISPHAMKN